MLCVATSCCCSPSAPRKPNACVPKPTTATTASSTSAPAAQPATRARSRQAAGPAPRMAARARRRPSRRSRPRAGRPPRGGLQGSSKRVCPPRARGACRFCEPPAPAPRPRSSSTSVSLCAPPTASSKQHGIQADEHGRRLGRASHLACRARRQGDRREAGRDSHQLESPQTARQPERGKRVGAEREQGPVGGMLERPADERKDSVGWSFGRHVGVGVQPVQHAQASKLEVAEDVLGDERRAEQQQAGWPPRSQPRSPCRAARVRRAA